MSQRIPYLGGFFAAERWLGRKQKKTYGRGMYLARVDEVTICLYETIDPEPILRAPFATLKPGRITIHEGPSRDFRRPQVLTSRLSRLTGRNFYRHYGLVMIIQNWSWLPAKDLTILTTPEDDSQNPTVSGDVAQG